MVKKYKCDKCDADVDEETRYNGIFIGPSCLDVDMCSDCWKEFKAWIKG